MSNAIRWNSSGCGCLYWLVIAVESWLLCRAALLILWHRYHQKVQPCPSWSQIFFAKAQNWLHCVPGFCFIGPLSIEHVTHPSQYLQVCSYCFLVKSHFWQEIINDQQCLWRVRYINWLQVVQCCQLYEVAQEAQVQVGLLGLLLCYKRLQGVHWLILFLQEDTQNILK